MPLAVPRIAVFMFFLRVVQEMPSFAASIGISPPAPQSCAEGVLVSVHQRRYCSPGPIVSALTGSFSVAVRRFGEMLGVVGGRP
jgi:hypothetical protein